MKTQAKKEWRFDHLNIKLIKFFSGHIYAFISDCIEILKKKDYFPIIPPLPGPLRLLFPPLSCQHKSDLNQIPDDRITI